MCACVCLSVRLWACVFVFVCVFVIVCECVSVLVCLCVCVFVCVLLLLVRLRACRVFVCGCVCGWFCLRLSFLLSFACVCVAFCWLLFTWCCCRWRGRLRRARGAQSAGSVAVLPAPVARRGLALCCWFCFGLLLLLLSASGWSFFPLFFSFPLLAPLVRACLVCVYCGVAKKHGRSAHISYVFPG